MLALNKLTNKTSKMEKRFSRRDTPKTRNENFHLKKKKRIINRFLDETMKIGWKHVRARRRRTTYKKLL